ncbi:MAG TPA: DUF6624 domain-containing protein, partial [Planctomycetia bacterium]|nr:DUF6624 domain-containing protein [Planctomycetia bacterium]
MNGTNLRRLLGMSALLAATAAARAGADDPALAKWLAPQEWKREGEGPALSLGEKGKFDDQHVFAPHVVMIDGEYWMYYCGSQRCVDAGTYKGKVKDPKRPERSDQRLFKLGLAKSKDGVHFTRHSTDPVFSFGDDVHSVVTAAILKNPDGSVCREHGKLRMFFAAVDFPRGTYKHDLYETTSADGVNWSKPTHVMANAYAPCVVKDGDRYRMWYTWIDKHPWHTNHAESMDGTHWTISPKPCIVMDQKWEVKDQVYPMVVKADGVWLMLYGCYWNDDKHTALGFAASTDGLTWTKHANNPVFRPNPKNDWESNFTTSQSLMRLPDGSFRLWYAGRKQPPWSNLYFAIGAASWKGPAPTQGEAQFAELRRELLGRRESDQATREKLMALMAEHELSDPKKAAANPEAMAKFKSLVEVCGKADAANTAYLKTVLAKHDWITEKMVGKDAAQVAFLIAQHADHDREFQAMVLARMKKHHVEDAATRKAIAYLTDRLAVAAKKPQVYGTQFQTEASGKLKLFPI